MINRAKREFFENKKGFLTFFVFVLLWVEIFCIILFYNVGRNVIIDSNPSFSRARRLRSIRVYSSI